MRRTRLAKLPCRSAAWAAIRWLTSYEANKPTGCLLYGPSGSGKTRTAYMLACANVRGCFREEWDGYSTEFLRAVDFQNEVIDRSRGGTFSKWFDRLIYADMVVIDDADKAKFTPAVETAFFNLLDFRCEHDVSMIITLNSDAAGFEKRLSKETGPAIVRRIREFFLPVRFSL